MNPKPHGRCRASKNLVACECGRYFSLDGRGNRLYCDKCRVSRKLAYCRGYAADRALVRRRDSAFRDFWCLLGCKSLSAKFAQIDSAKKVKV